MTNIGFWNVDLLRNLETDDRALAQCAVGLALERSLDLLFLIECRLPQDVLLTGFNSSTQYYPIASAERFKVLARFDPRFMERQTVPVPNNRFDIWQLTLPAQQKVIIGAVHGLDKRNNSPAKQELFLQQFASALTYVEKRLGYDRTIVLGDFNSNPFESPIASALGMNATSSGAIAQEGNRQVLGQTYPFFYNPMWNLYGDQRGQSVPATYYYRGSDPHELYWHMLDQVLIRPSLINRLAIEGMEIVTSILGQSLVKNNGTPDRTKFSDHLPVVFEIDLTTSNINGASDE